MNPVMLAILTRRSIRRFTDQPIPGKVLDMILQAVYHDPTGHNMQTWRFTGYTEYKLNLLKSEQSLDNYLMLLADKNLLCDIFIDEAPKILEDGRIRELIQNASKYAGDCDVNIGAFETIVALSGLEEGSAGTGTEEKGQVPDIIINFSYMKINDGSLMSLFAVTDYNYKDEHGIATKLIGQ